MAREILREVASKALAAVNRPLVTDSSHWSDIPTLPAGIYEMTYAEKDKEVLRKIKRDHRLPKISANEKAYCFEWADGQGVCAFKRKKDAVAWMEADSRQVTKFWYGEPMVGERRIRVKTKYTGDSK